MARKSAELPAGTRITDFISLGVVADKIPLHCVNKVLQETGKASQRQRALPAHVMVFYVITMAFYMHSSCREVLRCLLEGVQWLLGPGNSLKIAGRSGIAQARARLGSEPLERLYGQVVQPIAVKEDGRVTEGGWYKDWRLTSFDGSTLDVADTVENVKAFGKPKASRGESAYPQIRFVALAENGTHVLFAAQMGGYATSEGVLCDSLPSCLTRDMLNLADRGFFSYERWKTAQKTGAALLWRMKKNHVLPVHERLEDGSYLSKVYPSENDRKYDRRGIRVRVIEYTLPGLPDSEPRYRLITTILEAIEAPAEELAELYHDRWEIENAFDEFKTHLRGRQMVLRSKTPDLVKQEFYGLLLAHFAIRGLMHEAALKAGMDPDRLSFTHTVRVVRRKMALSVAFPPSALRIAP